MASYWVKGYPFISSDKKRHSEKAVIHHFDTLKEALFFKGQIAEGEILDWGDGEKLLKRR